MSDLLVYANAATRDARLPHPTAGQAVVLLDTGAVLIYYGTLYGWRPPWNVAWGEVTRVELAAGSSESISPPSSGRLHPVTSLAVTLPAIPNGRRYRVEVALSITSGAQHDLIQFGVRMGDAADHDYDAGDAWRSQLADVNIDPLTSPSPFNISLTAAVGYHPYGGNAQVWAGQVWGSGGAVTSDTNATSRLTVYDVGPNF